MKTRSGAVWMNAKSRCTLLRYRRGEQHGNRYVADPAKGIAEMARVAKKVVILEFGQPRNAILRALYKFYSRYFLPSFGGLVTGNREAYEYLEFSSAHFPSGAEFVELMRRSANFTSIDYEPLTFG